VALHNLASASYGIKYPLLYNLLDVQHEVLIQMGTETYLICMLSLFLILQSSYMFYFPTNIFAISFLFPDGYNSLEVPPYDISLTISNIYNLYFKIII